jgi:urea transporter
MSEAWPRRRSAAATRRRRLENALTWAIGIGVIVAVVALVGTVSTLVVQWAWNTLMPPIFGLPELSFWQALALSILLSAVGKAVQVATHGRGG